jgi:hypothetical protein
MLCWQADGRGGSYGGVDDRPTDPRRAWVWADAGRGRGGDRRPSASAGGAAPPGCQAAVHAGGSDAARRTREAVAPRTLGGLSGYTVDVAALASGADRPTLDLPADRSQSAGLDDAVVELVLRLARENPR